MEVFIWVFIMSYTHMESVRKLDKQKPYLIIFW